MDNTERDRQYAELSTKTISVELMEDVLRRIDDLARRRGWNRDEAIAALISVGFSGIEPQDAEGQKPMDQLTDCELRAFKDNRLKQLEAHYSVLHFQNYRLWHDNDAQAQILSGLLPQFESAIARIAELESEIRRLRKLVPESESAHSTAPFVSDRECPPENEPEDIGVRLRGVFGEPTRDTRRE
jgi:hypothetical protein